MKADIRKINKGESNGGYNKMTETGILIIIIGGALGVIFGLMHLAISNARLKTIATLEDEISWLRTKVEMEQETRDEVRDLARAVYLMQNLDD